MYDLTNFTLGDMTKCGSALRRIGAGAKSMEEVAERIVCYLYENLIDKQTGEKSCVLVRFYKTQPYGELDEELREFARSMLGNQPKLSAVKCLTLLATAGEKPEWNSKANSVGHKSIPLPSEKMIAQFPMISQLIHQLGVNFIFYAATHGKISDYKHYIPPKEERIELYPDRVPEIITNPPALD